MDSLIAWVLQNYGALGLTMIVGGYGFWHLRMEQKDGEKRYIDLVEKTIASGETGRDKYENLAVTTIKSLGDVHASHQRLRDLIDERCPKGGR